MNALPPMMNATMEPSWAIHPQPREDELLESWIVRLAEANLVPNRWVLGELELGNYIGALRDIVKSTNADVGQSKSIRGNTVY